MSTAMKDDPRADPPRGGLRSPTMSSLPHHPRKLSSAPPPPPPPAAAAAAAAAANEPTTAEQASAAPADLSPAGWAKIEAEYWRDARAARALEDQSMDEKYEMKTAALKARHAQLLDERARLNEQLQALKKQCDQVDEDLTRIDLQFEEAKEIVARRRQDQDENATRFFNANKEMALGRTPLQGNETASARQPPQTSNRQAKQTSHAYIHPNTPGSDVTAVDEPAPIRNGLATRRASALASAESSPLSQPPDDSTNFTGAEIWDHEGNFIDHIKKIKLHNKYISNILQISVKRKVIVRPGRKFSKESMQTIYEPSDNKGAKWLSCMIQATGEEQDVPCTSCMNRAGTWAGCVIVGGNDFPRCANCEWNRQGCSGSSYHQDRLQDPDIQANPYTRAPGSPHNADDSAQASREGSSAGRFTPVNGAQAGTSVPASAPPKRTSLPSKKGGRRSLPNMSSSGKENVEPADDSALGGEGADEESAAPDIDPGPDITAARLHLRDDGTVFTEPEIMRGVPLERIDSSHPYWDPKWEEPLIAIQAKYDEWQSKLEACLATGKNRFLAGRQVNRGKTIVEFLQNGDFHPYQLVSKKFITKGLVSYDTIFRLAQVIDELPKLGVDVKPVEWVRERMHELYTEQGDNFNLSKTVHELYHDLKLRALRSRAGVGNIGRPSGVKKGMSSKAVSARRKDPSDTPQRKRRRASTVTPKKANRASQAESTPVSHYNAKKQRLDMGKLPTPNGEEMSETASPDLQSVPTPHKGDEFHYVDYTSSDSTSSSKMTTTDWRIIQIRTPEHTTSSKHTQYLHWVAEGDNAYFEHQVLLSVSPASWGVYQDPFDFHVRLAELDKIEYTSDEDCRKIVIHITPSSGVKDQRKILVHFKRGRTQDRFLHFVKHKLRGLRPLVLQEVTREFIENEWVGMDSEVLPVED